jgi:hypothetical protein
MTLATLMEGMCCKIQWVGNECDGSFGGVNEHECVLKPGKSL